MTKPRRPRLTRESELTPSEWAFLCDEPCADETRRWEWWALTADCASFREDRPSVADLWAMYGEDVLAEWVEARPGSRPSLWWRYSAPRAREAPEHWLNAEPAPDPRRRLGGVGTPSHECLAYALRYHRGIPASWVTQSQNDYYNGRRKDIHGRVIPAHYTEGHFPHPAIDPDDPPAFESEAGYLDRHGLFRPGERERLTDGDFEPETVEPRDA